MSERRRGEERDPSVERERTRVPAKRGGQTSDAEGSRRDRTRNWDRNHSDTERTNVGIRVQSRMPDLDDYDRNAHAYRESYLDPPNGYSIGVSACGGLEVPLDPDVREDLIKEIERERRYEPGPGDDRVRPRDRTPSVNLNRHVVPDDVVAWHWTLEDENGEVVSRAKRSANMGPDACGAMLRAPALGRYRANLRLELRNGEETASKSFVLRKDRLIVSIGDSYASGQGVPDEPSHPLPDGGRSDPVWVEPKAHRSFESGPARGVEAFEKPQAGNLTTFVSYAATGATIDRGLLNAQHDWQSSGQLEELQEALGDRPIDALLLSIGGNDVGFADGFKDLLYRIHKSRSSTVKAAEEKIEGLVKGTPEEPAKLDQLAERIEALDPGPEEVFITEYPIAHFDRKDDGTVGGGCGVFNWRRGIDKIAPSPWNLIARTVLPKISTADARAIKRLGEKLNAAIETAADEHGWTYVDGVAEGFQGHGYCRSSERFFVTASESSQKQRDYLGMMHPNSRGYAVYRDQIAGALREQLGDKHDLDRGVRDHRDRTPPQRRDTNDRREDDSDASARRRQRSADGDRERRTGGSDRVRVRRDTPTRDRGSGSRTNHRKQRR